MAAAASMTPAAGSYTAVKPGRGSKLPVRHFLEVLAWRARPGREGKTVQELEWRAVEIRGTRLSVAARTTLDTVDSLTAAEAPPADARMVTMRMLGNGQIRWQTAREPRAAGLITRPGAARRAAARRPDRD